MPYKDKEARLKASRESMRKKREFVDGLTSEVNKDEGLTQYPAILLALTDLTKRRKLEKIYQSLRDFKQEKNVFYGYPRLIPFDVVGDLLEATS